MISTNPVREVQAFKKVNPTLQNLLTPTLRVNDLLQIGGREWNMELLEALFPISERRLIEENMSGGIISEDKYNWGHTKSRLYIIKSGYWTLTNY